MKRAISLLIAVVFVVGITAPSFAALPERLDKGVKTVKTGLVDIASIPYNLAKGTYDETKASEFKPFGLFGGVMKSSVEAVKTVITAAVHIGMIPLDMIKK